jgi:hypothetical protein
MDLVTDHEVPDMANYKCYKIGNTLYVPHYTVPGLYVGPSVRRETKFIKADYVARQFYRSELIKMGASVEMHPLWVTPARDQR